MKKLCFAFLLAFVPLKLHAAIVDPDVIREKTFVIHFTTTVPASVVAGSSVTFDLISLATTTGVFPHTERGEIDISHINVILDKAAASTGTVKIGVMNFLNTSSGSIAFFYPITFQKNVVNSQYIVPNNFTPAFYRCRVKSAATATSTDVDGTTPFLVTNEKIIDSPSYRISSQLFGPTGLITPAVGDILMEVRNFDSTNTIILYVDIFYHSEW